MIEMHNIYPCIQVPPKKFKRNLTTSEEEEEMSEPAKVKPGRISTPAAVGFKINIQKNCCSENPYIYDRDIY